MSDMELAGRLVDDARSELAAELLKTIKAADWALIRDEIVAEVESRLTELGIEVKDEGGK